MAETRERWDSRGAFIMAAIGSAVGLGNVWRFPYIAYDNGGGAFFIPYFVALLTAGIPLMIVEYALGVRFQGSAARSFRKVGRGWEWLGWWALMVGSVISFYYCVIMAWSWRYLYDSVASIFTGGVPWAGDRAKDCFYNGVLHLSKGPGEVGGLVWPIVGGLALTWLSIWWIIHKGVKRVGKIVMLTVPLPVLILVVLFIRGVTLEGAASGISFYLTPDFAALTNPRVWVAAYGQIFFSLSLGFGILIAYASYLPKRSDITNNAFITSFSNCLTSFFAGFVVFSVLGFLAHQKGVPVKDVLSSGPGLAFVTYPTAIAKIQMGNFLIAVVSALFFLMLLSLGVDSAFSIVEGMVTGLHDKFRANRGVICALMCTFGFLAGLVFCTDAGLYYLDIADNWMSKYGLALVGLMECIVVGWFFGSHRLRKLFRREHPELAEGAPLCGPYELKQYVNEVSDFRVGWWWDLCIMVVTPGILTGAIVLNFLDYLKEGYLQGPGKPYPTWAVVLLGWGLAGLVVLLGIFFMVLRGGRDEGEEVAS